MKTTLPLTAEQLQVHLANKSICTGLTFTIAPGEIWGLLGQNGSGKTTLLHTLGGLRMPQAGRVYLGEQPLARYSARQRAERLGILFQRQEAVFPQTVWDYCLAGRYPHVRSFREGRVDWEATQNALKTLQLDLQHKQNILTLSGGEWRRLTLATLLAQDPGIYLLDEPLNHLDVRHQKRLLEHFRSSAREKKISVLMAVHDINIAEAYCDRIVMLFGEGETRVGSKEDLLTEENLCALYGHPLTRLRAGEKRWWI